VAGIAGRDRARTAAVAERLAAEFGHPVAVFADAPALAHSGVAALVVAAPPEHHEVGLRAALAAGIACLCEKPLVPAERIAAGRELVAAFGGAGLLLFENCQWPYVLPALAALHPRRERASAPRLVAMGLSPSQAGAAMVADSLSHLLSVVQALLPDDAELQLRAAAHDARSPAATADVVRLSFDWRAAAADARCGAPAGLPTGPPTGLTAELHLQVCPQPPRPAWLAVDGVRMDRQIGPDHAIAFAAAARTLAIADPMDQLVAAFAAALARPEPLAAARESRRIDARLRCYGAALSALLWDAVP
jgi:predicted dehydrogenase